MKMKRLVAGAILAAALINTRILADDAAPAAPADAAPKKPGLTLVNLHLQQAMPQDAFDELAKQGGVKFTTMGNFWDQPNMQTENDIDMTDKPFWSAVNQVCNLWGLAPQQNNWGPNPSPKQIQLNFSGNGQKGKAPVFESDGFLVQALSFNRNQSVNYAMPEQSQNNCSVQLMVFIDPSLHISNFNQNPKVTVAVDDAGHSMVPDANNNVFYGGMQQRSMIYNLNVGLKYPDNAGKKISDLKFTLSMRGSDTLDSLSVDKPLEAAESSKNFGDTTVVFHSAKKNGNGYEVKIGITNDQQNGGNAWGTLQSAQLLDAKGRAYNYGGGGGGGGRPDGLAEYTINYMANGGMPQDNPSGDPVKWVLELPAKTHAIKVPVEFKDLPLP